MHLRWVPNNLNDTLETFPLLVLGLFSINQKERHIHLTVFSENDVTSFFKDDVILPASPHFVKFQREFKKNVVTNAQNKYYYL